MSEIKDWLPVILALVAVGIQWGTNVATLRAFRREVDELHKVVDKITGVETRLALVEQTVKRIDESIIPEIKRELVYQHDSHKASIAEVRGELAQCRTAHD